MPIPAVKRTRMETVPFRRLPLGPDSPGDDFRRAMVVAAGINGRDRLGGVTGEGIFACPLRVLLRFQSNSPGSLPVLLAERDLDCGRQAMASVSATSGLQDCSSPSSVGSGERLVMEVVSEQAWALREERASIGKGCARDAQNERQLGQNAQL